MELYELIYHLKKCPEAFMQIRETKPGEIPITEVLLKDLYRKISGRFDVADTRMPSLENIPNLTENHRMSIHVGVWFFSHNSFLNLSMLILKINQFLLEDLKEVCELVKFRQWVEDDDRAEEFVRLALEACELLPAGESFEVASDKLDALDTVKRQQVLKDSNIAIERMREIRKKMAEQKAREAANVYGRD